MRRFIYNVSCFVLLQVLIGVTIYAVYPVESDRYIAWGARLKKERMETAPPPRIIFVGGSNLAFGLDSHRIKEAFGREPVNLGLHGGLGPFFMLNEITPEVRPGDVVVLSFEYDLMCDYDPQGQLKFILDHRPETIRFIDWPDWRFLLDHGLHYMGGVVRTTMGAARNPTPAVTGPAPTRAFNAYGDLVLHHRMANRELPAPRRMAIRPSHLRKLVTRLNRFHAHCTAMDAQVVLSLPPYLETHYEMNRNVVHDAVSRLRAESRVPLLNAPEDLVLPSELFFDTQYHLNREGTKRRTEHLVKTLGAHLAAERKTSGPETKRMGWLFAR